jgi:hypothetical protein
VTRSLRGAGLALGAAILQLPRTASGTPQFDVGATAAACFRAQPSPTATDFCLGARGDLWLLRQRDADWGLGPYADVWTAGFDDLHLGAGMSIVAPAWPAVPFVLSFGPAYDASRSNGEFTATLFWGPASYNFHSPYALTNGVFLRIDRGFASTPTTRISIGVRIDMLWLALPFVIAYEAARGP